MTREPNYSIPLLLQDPRVVGRRERSERDQRRDNVIAIAIVIAETGELPPRVLTSLQLAVEMLRNAEKETTT